MIILQLVTKRQYRGAELSAWNLSRKLIERGHTIVWVGLYPNHDDVLELEHAMNEDLPGEHKSFFNLQKAQALKKIIQTIGVDVIQANGAETLKYAVAAGMLGARKPIVYRNISQVSFWMKGSPLKKWVNGFLLNRADRIVSVGEASKNDMVKCFPVLAKKTSVIHRGVPVKSTDKTTAARLLKQRYALSDESRIMFWAGAFSPEKNPGMLVEVMKVLKGFNPHIVLLMAGKGPLFTDIQHQIEQEGLEKNILLAGYQKDLAPYYAGADLFVLVSHIEGVPGVILEAAMQQTPAVTVQVGGVDEVVEQDVTGVVVHNYNPGAFANAVHALMSNEHQREQMGKRAYEFVLSKYNEDVNTRKFESLYQQLTASS
ncbi:MAG TPA: glycosyltransferase family 4 protein [Ferruginibacter sp.]|nr:glycosyltransferase family 4 protein [Ferruginibacter sp.]HRO17816.1 glycosyltransferase family 4 protein [Ferruginibacter sp.]HRQ21252.1 glycosyltransferase family 4 protein [Ferruginibacter sp.]